MLAASGLQLADGGGIYIYISSDDEIDNSEMFPSPVSDYPGAQHEIIDLIYVGNGSDGISAAELPNMHNGESSVDPDSGIFTTSAAVVRHVRGTRDKLGGSRCRRRPWRSCCSPSNSAASQ